MRAIPSTRRIFRVSCCRRRPPAQTSSRFANAGGDLNNALKQAHEFGLAQKQRLASFVFNITNMPALGLETAAGSLICTPFYWDFNDGTRAFAKRFQARPRE